MYMRITAWYGRTNEMNGRLFQSAERALTFLRKKKDSVRYVEISCFEHAGRISMSTCARMDV
jgi:hypothetical protein